MLSFLCSSRNVRRMVQDLISSSFVLCEMCSFSSLLLFVLCGDVNGNDPFVLSTHYFGGNVIGLE